MENQFQITQAMKDQAKMLFDLWSTLRGNAKMFDPLGQGTKEVTITEAVERNSASGNPMKVIKWTDTTTGQSAITYTLQKRFKEFAQMKPVQVGDTYDITHKKAGSFSNVKIIGKKDSKPVPEIRAANTYSTIFMYDIEIFMRYNLLVAFDIFKENWYVIDDTEDLRKFYLETRDSLFVGYNNIGYDEKVTRGWLQGKNAYAVSKTIIEGKDKSLVYKLFDSRKTPFFNMDLYQDNRGFSLKEHEAFLGLDIRETEVDFDSPEELTPEQKEQTIKYCKHDVTATLYRFYQNIGMLLAKVVICAKFDLEKTDVGLTNANLTAKILGAIKKEHNDLFDEFELPENFEIENEEVLNNFVDRVFEKDEKGNPVLSLTVEEQDNLEHGFGSGGLHAALESFINVGEMWHRDVNSLYPNIMIVYLLLSRNIPDELLGRYNELLVERLNAKHSKEKTYTINGVTIPLKVLINGIKLPLNTKYGAEGAEFNQLYDPRNRLWVCIVGQLAMWDLFEKIKPYTTVIQSNTDAHDYIVNEGVDSETLESIFTDWEERTGLKLDGEVYHEMYQKDVNNYIKISYDDGVETKGAIGLTHGLKISKAIVSNAFINYVVGGHDYVDYIKECNDLRQFQIISKTGYTYDYTIQIDADGNETKEQKVNRIFAVTDPHKSVKLYKVKELTEDDSESVVADLLDDSEEPEETIIEKDRSLTVGVPNAPVHYAISNEAVGSGITIDEIEKTYYINEVEKLLVLWFGDNWKERIEEAHSKRKEGINFPKTDYIKG